MDWKTFLAFFLCLSSHINSQGTFHTSLSTFSFSCDSDIAYDIGICFPIMLTCTSYCADLFHCFPLFGLKMIGYGPSFSKFTHNCVASFDVTGEKPDDNAYDSVS